MILLVGGTSETAPIATALAEAGYEVLVSTATDARLDVGSHPAIRRRCGRLTIEEMADLARVCCVTTIIDAAHPYATLAHETARKAAQLACVPCVRYNRASILTDRTDAELVACHEEAAALAFSYGKPVLLTTGSRNLKPYAAQSRLTGLTLMARVLDHAESIAACREAGLANSQIISGRGPFTVDENRATIRRHGIGVLVTKESGSAGGFEAKMEAARAEKCRVIVIARPYLQPETSFVAVREIIEAVGCIPYSR